MSDAAKRMSDRKIRTVGSAFTLAERNLNANLAQDCGIVLCAWDETGRYHVTNANDAELIAVLEGMIAAIKDNDKTLTRLQLPT